MTKPCSCSLEVLVLMDSLSVLLEIHDEHAKTGRLRHTDITEIREKIEKSKEQLKRVGELCGIDITSPAYLLENALQHYEGGLQKGDIHSFSEAAEIAAESELPLLRELWGCRDKEIKES